MAYLAKTSFNWDKLFPSSPRPPSPSLRLLVPLSPVPQSPIKIAVARDKAFNFYYQDNLDLLLELGAELVFWSPLQDSKIPDDVRGLYFGGGFPEIFAPQLAENKTVLQQLQQIVRAGIPTYAECGGLMYLCQQLVDLTGQTYSMAGVIPNTVNMEAKLTLGYRQGDRSTR